MDVNKQIEELQANNVPVYSISRLDSINNCKYEAYLTYIEGNRGIDSVYTLLGGKMHEMLEAIVNDELDPKEMADIFKREVETGEMFGVKFINEAVKNNYKYNLLHYCNNYKKPEGKFITEERVLFQTPKGNYVQGFIDLIKVNEDGSLDIIDYKTSKKYKKKEAQKHARQLIVYAMAKEKQGFKINRIGWDFLKYVEVSFDGYRTSTSKVRKPIKKKMERKSIAFELSHQVEMMLKEEGYDDILTDAYLDQFRKENDFNVLPEEIANRFVMNDLIVEYELSDETRQECLDYIDNTIEVWENTKEYLPREMYKTQSNGEKKPDVFYCTCLCGHRKECKYIKDFSYEKEIGKEDNIF